MTAPKLFADRAARDDLRKMIVSQAIGRFNNNAADDPFPHVLWRLLDDMDVLEAEVTRWKDEAEFWDRKAGEEHGRCIELEREIARLQEDKDK